jgi:hypothetical protein
MKMPVIARTALHLKDNDNSSDSSLAEYGTTAPTGNVNSIARIRPVKPVSDDRSQADSIRDCICSALLKSGYPLRNVDCWCDEKTVVLYGRVTRYFYAQVALETAMPLSNGRKIETRIDVVRIVESASSHR